MGRRRREGRINKIILLISSLFVVFHLEEAGLLEVSHHLLASRGRLAVVELPGLEGVPVLGLHLGGGIGGLQGRQCVMYSWYSRLFLKR